MAAPVTAQTSGGSKKGEENCCSLDLRAFTGASAAAAVGHERRPLAEGNAASLIRVLVYEDLQCPDCAAFRKMLDKELLPRYGRQIAFEHRDFPLPKHNWARSAAIAARYFEEIRPDLAVAFRRRMLENIRTTSAISLPVRISEFAQANGIDAKKTLAALENPRYASLVEADFQEGVARGIRKTPTVIVNGTPFVESIALTNITKAIDAALAAQPKSN